MMISQMEGSDRALLTESLDIFLTRTKAAIGTNQGSFLPTTAAEEQVTKLERAKGAVPAFDDVERDVEIIEPLVGVCRNALVIHVRVLDKEVRGAEVKRKVSTRATDAKMDDKIFKAGRCKDHYADWRHSRETRRGTEAVNPDRRAIRALDLSGRQKRKHRKAQRRIAR